MEIRICLHNDTIHISNQCVHFGHFYGLDEEEANTMLFFLLVCCKMTLKCCSQIPITRQFSEPDITLHLIQRNTVWVLWCLTL